MIPMYENEKKYIYNKQSDFILSAMTICSIMGAGFQFCLGSLFGISFNLLYIEIILLGLFLLFMRKSRFDIKINYNFIVLCLSVTMYLGSLIFVNSNYTSIFMLEFIRNCLFIIIAFIFDVNFDIMISQVKVAAILEVILIELMFLFNKESIFDYMTFGFHYMTALSFLLLYCYREQKWVGVAVCCILCLQMLTYSARSNWYITAVLFLVVLYGLTEKKNVKVVGTIAIVIISYHYSILLMTLLDWLAKTFSGTTYAVRNLQRMLMQSDQSQILGARSEIYDAAINAIKNHPMGMGIGGFSSRSAVYPHNIVLDIWVTFGIVLGSLLIGFIIYIVIKSIKVYPDKKYQLLLSWAIINFTRLFTTHTFVCEPIFFLVICLAICGICRRDRYDYNHNTNL